MNNPSHSASRRQFLGFAGSAAAAVLAGCSGVGTGTERTSPDVDTDDWTPADDSTSTSSPPPTVTNIALSYDDPAGGPPREITVHCSVSAPAGLVTIELGVDGREIVHEVDGIEQETVELAAQVAGGSDYEASVRATDERGTETVETVRTRYLAAPTNLVDDDRLVGVHYYGWWGSGWHWDSGYRGTPTLGEYNSRDRSVLRRHFNWCREYGVNWLNLSWWGAGSWSDVTFREHLLESDALGDLEVSILYESANQLTQDPGWNIDFDAHGNREQFVNDVAFLAEEYFSHSNYLRIDGSPVIYLYVAGVSLAMLLVHSGRRRKPSALTSTLSVISRLSRSIRQR